MDLGKLPEKIHKVETIMFERLQAIAADTDHSEEREALTFAASLLRWLKKEKLSYPDWKPEQE
jgi:hypothetical protein